MKAAIDKCLGEREADNCGVDVRDYRDRFSTGLPLCQQMKSSSPLDDCTCVSTDTIRYFCASWLLSTCSQSSC